MHIMIKPSRNGDMVPACKFARMLIVNQDLEKSCTALIFIHTLD